MWQIISNNDDTISIKPKNGTSPVEPAALTFLAEELPQQILYDITKIDALLSDLTQTQQTPAQINWFIGSFGRLTPYIHNEEAEFGPYNPWGKKFELHTRLPLQHFIDILKLYKDYLISKLPAERTQPFAYDEALALRFAELTKDIIKLHAQQSMRSGLFFLTRNDHEAVQGKSTGEIDAFLSDLMKRVGFRKNYGWSMLYQADNDPVRATAKQIEALLAQLLTVDLVMPTTSKPPSKDVKELGAKFVQLFKPSSSFYYANSGMELTELPHTEGLTPYTFEGCVVGIDDQKVAFVWFGCED